MADQKTVPDDEAEHGRDRGAGGSKLRIERGSPHQPIERQHTNPDGDKLLLDLEGAVDGPELGAFEIGARGKPIVRVDDRAQDTDREIEDDVGYGVTCASHGSDGIPERGALYGRP